MPRISRANRGASQQAHKALSTLALLTLLTGCATNHGSPQQAERDARIREREQAEKQAKKSAYRTRVTNNPEATKGCQFLESLTRYVKVIHFQQDVVRAGGNLGYVVATNEDGEVIGEAYRCPEEAK